MPVIGTAGHVDHGKSTLVMALTGRDPDRWEEEKRRGLTIDLGFGWTTLPSGAEVGFVDVPGHEKFLKNMLAGIESIDVALLVVAADEGWMPQTEEHLAVLDAIAIENVVVAVSRIDLVDDETAQLAVLEIEDLVEGTVAAGAPIVLTSATTGVGMDDLIAELDRAVAAAGISNTERPRLWVDRVFPVTGAGTVVTGTLTGGSLAVDDKLWLWPLGREVRVRGLHSHDQERDGVGPGNRTAASLVGVDHAEISRGAMLGKAEDWVAGDRWLVRLRTVRKLEDPLTSRGAYSIHMGAGAWPVRIHPLEQQIAGSGLAVATLSEAVPAAAGDRFILFDSGRRMVVAGGELLDPDAPRPADSSLAGLSMNSADERAAALLATRGADTAGRLKAHSGGGQITGAVKAGGMLLSHAWAESKESEAKEHTESYQRANPLRPGIPKAQLASQLGVRASVLEALIEWSDGLVESQAAVATAGFSGTLRPEDEAVWQGARSRLEADGFAPTKVSELKLGPELVHALARKGDLEELGEGLFYLPSTLESLVERVQAFSEPFTVSEFRDAMGVTRRHAVPMLEWLDRKRVTSRQGDVRVVIKSDS